MLGFVQTFVMSLGHIGGSGSYDNRTIGDFRCQKNGNMGIWSDKADFRIIGGRLIEFVLYIGNCNRPLERVNDEATLLFIEMMFIFPADIHKA